MLEYISNVVVPHVNNARVQLDLPLRKKALAIFDVFSAHRHERVLEKLKQANIAYVFIPAGCTDQLQPLDLKVNKVFKDSLKKQFNNWYAEKVNASLRKSKNAEVVDLRLSSIKCTHAMWLESACKDISSDLIKLAFELAGI